tara:strand:- start:13421 stop:13993 length:573 start_codon:yes stop_codon:yes gene_type:complete
MDIKLTLNNRTLYNASFYDFACKVTGTFYKIPIDINATRSRKKDIVLAKQIVIYICKKHLNITLHELRDFVGYRHHASVIHANRQITNLISWDKKLKAELEEIETATTLEAGITNEINLEKDYYFINLNDVKSLKESIKRAVVLTGYSPDEIEKVKNALNMKSDIPVVAHSNTGHYLFIKHQKPITNENL